jgi:hypothetical protein
MGFGACCEDCVLGEKDQVEFEDDDLDTYDDFDDDTDLDGDTDESIAAVDRETPYTKERIDARHEIERRAELKALRDELDDWDDIDVDDL